MLDASHVTRLHDQANIYWHNSYAPPPGAGTSFERLILEQHRANFDLWHREDDARDPMSGDQAIAACKRSIDKLNQRRNDLAERIDLALLASLQPQPETAPLHSETPGLMIDRLSILALKIFHTGEETRRKDATEDHHQRNRDRLTLLLEQREDLASCLAILWSEVLAGTRRFKLYRQLKMYNDPDLNPVLYAHSGSSN